MTQLAFFPDGRLLAAHKSGGIRLIDPRWSPYPEPVWYFDLNLVPGGPGCHKFKEMGLLGMLPAMLAIIPPRMLSVLDAARDGLQEDRAPRSGMLGASGVSKAWPVPEAPPPSDSCPSVGR